MGQGRAIGAGGSTGAQFFRFVPGEAGYEASQVNSAGNVLVGSDSPVNWINIDGGVFGHNYVRTPNTWVMRMLNENVGNPAVVETRNGVFRDNVVVYDDGLSRISNHDGAGVQEQTFAFARNRWFNLSTNGPAGQGELQLPAPETGGVYGVNPNIDPNESVAFATSWGRWIVNPHLAADTVSVTNFSQFSLATPGTGAVFDPLAADPFIGNWSFTPLTGPNLTVDVLSQRILAFTPVPEPAGVLALAGLAWAAWRVSRRAGPVRRSPAPGRG